MMLASWDLPATGSVAAVLHNDRLFITVPTPTGTQWAEIPKAQWPDSPLAKKALQEMKPVHDTPDVPAVV